MKTWIARYWPSSVVTACLAYIVLAFMVSLVTWALLPQMDVGGYVNTIQLLFPAVLLLVFINLLGPKLGVGLALIVALLTAAIAYRMNRKSLRLGLAALLGYLLLSAWMFISKNELYALAGITQP